MPEELFKLAAAEGIGVKFAYLPRPLLGLYDSRPKEQPAIILHNNIYDNRRLLRCILAEELGHHFTSAGNLLAFARSDKKTIALKQEKQAVWWAVQHLMPLNELIIAVNSGLFLTYELAEHFDVTERFCGTGIKLYFEKKNRKLLKGLKVLPEEVNF